MDSRSVVPPMSTTSLPSSSEPLESPPPSLKPPILASDILREEVAPLAPASAAMRGWLLTFAVGLAGLAVASFERALPASPLATSASLVAAGAALVAWLRPVPYAARAGLGTLAGLLPLLLGARHVGPLYPLGAEGDLSAGATLALLTVLPAALLFRAQYRAFPGARAFLAGALLLAGPAALLLGRGALSEATPLALRLADVLVITAILTSFAGFLGPETTGACTLWGALLMVSVPARGLVSGVLARPHAAGVAAASAAALGCAVASAVVAVGLHQLAAVGLARRARRVDVRRIVGPSAEEP